MNVLLMTSPSPDRLPFCKRERSFPLGLGFLISVLRQAGHNVHFIDSALSQNDILDSGFLKENRIDCVGIHAFSTCYSETLRILRNLQRKRERGIWRGTLIIGGPHPTVYPESVPDYVDYVVQGEGEPAIVDAVERRGPRLIRHPRIKDLDTLPRPAYDCFASLPYDFRYPDLEASPVFTMNTSRGCPFSCTFCGIPSIWGTEYTTFSPERIVDDMKFLQKTFGVQGINFREDNFAASPKRVRTVCELILREGLRIAWMCEARVNALDREMLTLMKRAGCEAIYVGAESGSQRVLDLMNKQIKIEDTVRVVELCKELGVRTLTTFFFGFPGETAKERVETVAFIEKLQPSRWSYAIYAGVPGTPAYASARENDAFAYVSDQSGTGYVRGHDQLVEELYGGKKDLLIPWPDGVGPSEKSERERFDNKDLRDPSFRRKLAAYRRFTARAHRQEGHWLRTITCFASATRLEPLNARNWKELTLALLGTRVRAWLGRLQQWLRARNAAQDFNEGTQGDF